MTQFGLGEDVANAAAQGGENHVYTLSVTRIGEILLQINKMCIDE